MDDDIQARVQRGIALLDERVPGWRKKVDAGQLNLNSGYTCVLGQVFGDFYSGAGVLGLNIARDEEVPYGFAEPTFIPIGVERKSYAALTRVWREALQ